MIICTLAIVGDDVFINLGSSPDLGISCACCAPGPRFLKKRAVVWSNGYGRLLGTVSCMHMGTFNLEHGKVILLSFGAPF